MRRNEAIAGYLFMLPLLLGIVFSVPPISWDFRIIKSC